MGGAAIVELEAALAPLLDTGGRPDPAWLDIGRQWSAAVWAQADALGPTPLSPEEIERGLALAARPVFVCGAHRSGTSLVRNRLDGHPALAVLPSEGTFYTNLEARLAGRSPREQAAEMGQEWLRRFVNPSSQPPFWLLGRSSAEGSPYVEFARRLGAWWSVPDGRRLWPLVAVALAWAGRGDLAGVERWVEKTPTNEHHLARLWGEFPQAKVIHVIRRPEDALASHKALMGGRWRPGRAVAAIYRDLGRSLRIAVAQTPSDRYLLLRYEDLVGQAEETSRRLAEFLDIAPLLSLEQPTVAGRPVQANTSFAGDRERPALTRLERTILAAACGSAAVRLGYD